MRIDDSSGSEPRTILLVEDDDDTCEILALAFTTEGFRVLVANTIAAALVWLRSDEVIQFVITDYSLPDGVGETLLRDARDHGLLRGAGILLCTANIMVKSSAYGRVVHKPVDPMHLVTTVREHLATRAEASR